MPLHSGRKFKSLICLAFKFINTFLSNINLFSIKSKTQIVKYSIDLFRHIHIIQLMVLINKGMRFFFLFADFSRFDNFINATL